MQIVRVCNVTDAVEEVVEYHHIFIVLQGRINWIPSCMTLDCSKVENCIE